MSELGDKKNYVVFLDRYIRSTDRLHGQKYVDAQTYVIAEHLIAKPSSSTPNWELALCTGSTILIIKN